MISYTGFAEVYDAFMDNVPYDEWADYLIGLLHENGVKEGTVCDLACGTGSITERLYQAGFYMIGLDNSIDMLNIALQKKEEKDILYLCQDMREIELMNKVSAFVCICDGFNYLLHPTDLLEVFRKVNTYLAEDGVFIFDMNTIYKFKEVLGETTIAENREDMSFIWDNYYDEEEKINEYALTIYVKNGEEESFLRFDEEHYQRGYEIEEIKALLEAAGLELTAIYDAFTREAPKKESERLYFVVKKGRKEE